MNDDEGITNGRTIIRVCGRSAFLSLVLTRQAIS